MLDKGSPIPLYYQIADRIREEILTGTLPPGSQLPSERELTQRMGVSRMTTRQAVAYLVREGLLDVRPGVGTFVTEPKFTHNALHLLSFTEQMAERGEAVSSQVLEQTLVTPPKRMAEQLTLEPNEATVRIVRLRLANKTPVLLETTYLPARLCPGLERTDLTTYSLYRLLESEYGLSPQHARQTFEVTTANKYEQELFGLPAETVMILMEGVTYGANGQPVECFKAVYRGDRFKFAFESRRADDIRETAAVQLVGMTLTFPAN
jgi:GntR family transcriptional regulator